LDVIIVYFEVIDRLLISYSAFVRHVWKKASNYLWNNIDNCCHWKAI